MFPNRLPYQVSATTVRNPNFPREIATQFAVRVPAILNAGNPGPLIPTLGLWDTGATHSCITPQLASSLGLVPIAKGRTQGVHGVQVVDVYIVDILIPNTTVVFQNLRVSAAELPNHGLLIGMDIISKGDFSITHTDKETVFSFLFPSLLRPVDYLEEIHEFNSREKRLEVAKLNANARAQHRVEKAKNKKNRRKH